MKTSMAKPININGISHKISKKIQEKWKIYEKRKVPKVADRGKYVILHFKTALNLVAHREEQFALAISTYVPVYQVCTYKMLFQEHLHNFGIAIKILQKLNFLEIWERMSTFNC